jgi:hypothetical protein
MVDDRIRRRLNWFPSWLGDVEGFDGAFSVGDLLMVTVLGR